MSYGICFSNTGTINYCVNKGIINSLCCGILNSNQSNLTSCYNIYPLIYPDSYPICYVNSGTITGCYLNYNIIYNSIIPGNFYGICATNNSGIIDSCSYTGDVSLYSIPDQNNLNGVNGSSYYPIVGNVNTSTGKISNISIIFTNCETYGSQTVSDSGDFNGGIYTIGNGGNGGSIIFLSVENDGDIENVQIITQGNLYIGGGNVNATGVRPQASYSGGKGGSNGIFSTVMANKGNINTLNMIIESTSISCVCGKSVPDCYTLSGYIYDPPPNPINCMCVVYQNYSNINYCVFNNNSSLTIELSGSLPTNVYFSPFCCYNNGTIYSCYTKGSYEINVSGTSSGGIVGLNDGSLTYCYCNSDLTFQNGYCGGVVGKNTNVIKNCYYNGNIIPKTTGPNIAGICGLSTDPFSNCYSIMSNISSSVYQISPCNYSSCQYSTTWIDSDASLCLQNIPPIPGYNEYWTSIGNNKPFMLTGTTW